MHILTQSVVLFLFGYSFITQAIASGPIDLQGKMELSYSKCMKKANAMGMLRDGRITESEMKKLSCKVTESDDVKRLKGEVQATFLFIGSPVHEKLTTKALDLSEVFNKKTESTEVNFTRGVFWNDDPTILLWRNKGSHRSDTIGLMWYINFSYAEKKAEKGRVYENGDDLLARSHFGDLQFLHGMASKDCEPAQKTLENIMLWAEFTYKVGTGRIAPQTKMGKVPILGIVKLFDKDKKILSMDIAEFFGNSENTKEVALGSLLHMIQDSYFDGHAQREDKSQVINGKKKFGKGKIVEFHSYTNQNKKKHKAADKFPKGLEIKHPTRDSRNLDPINVCGELLDRAYKNKQASEVHGAEWHDIENFLKDTVFSLVDKTSLAGPGCEFKTDSYRKQCI